MKLTSVSDMVNKAPVEYSWQQEMIYWLKQIAIQMSEANQMFLVESEHLSEEGEE